jgi:hypothetical protein
MTLADLIVSLAFLAQVHSGAEPDQVMFVRHLQSVANIDAISARALHEAAEHFELDPFDLATTCITEHTGSVWDLSILGALRRNKPIAYTNRDGAAGEVGLCQISPTWLAKLRANVPELVDVSEETLRTDPSTNALAAAFVVSEAIRRHSLHGDDDPVAGPHPWWAHYKCAPYRASDPTSGRGYKCGTCGYSKRKWQRVRHSISRITPPLELLERHKAIWFEHCSDS